MDRGLLHFFKDGHDLGQAFAMEELTSGSFVPFLQTETACKLEVFHPHIYPEACSIPGEPPEPPADPVLTELSGDELADQDRQIKEM